MSRISSRRRFQPVIEHCEPRDVATVSLPSAAAHLCFAAARHAQSRVIPAELTAYSLVAIRNDTSREIKFTLQITTSSGMVVHKQQYALAPRGGVRSFDWTSNVKPSFTVSYTSFMSGGHPFVKDEIVTSRSKELPKPPTHNQIIEFGAIWKFRSSGTGVNEVITLEAERR